MANTMINHRYSIVFLGWFIALAGFAQEIEFQRFPPEQQQQTGTIHCMIQDRRGFLWLGAANGLFRYDGHEFRAYQHDPTDSASISGNHIWSICEDRRGDLWIGTSGRGLNCFLRDEERFVRYRHNPEDSASIAGVDEVPWVMEDRSDNIWVALWENGLDYRPRDATGFRHFPFRFPDEEGTLRSSVHRVYQDRFGDIWVGSRRGLYRLDPSGKRIIPYPHDPGKPANPGGNYVYALTEDRQGRLWIGTLDGGLSRYDRWWIAAGIYGSAPTMGRCIAIILCSANLIISAIPLVSPVRSAVRWSMPFGRGGTARCGWVQPGADSTTGRPGKQRSKAIGPTGSAAIL